MLKSFQTLFIQPGNITGRRRKKRAYKTEVAVLQTPIYRQIGKKVNY